MFQIHIYPTLSSSIFSAFLKHRCPSGCLRKLESIIIPFFYRPKSSIILSQMTLKYHHIENLNHFNCHSLASHQILFHFQLVLYPVSVFLYTINHSKESLDIQKDRKGRVSPSPLPILPLAIHHCHRRAHKCCHNCRCNDPRWIHAAILLPISNHVNRN